MYFHSFLLRFGVIAEPEVTSWQTLDANDRFLVVSSDGIFESMTPQDVCDLIHDSSSCSPSSSLAECIVNTAFEKGSVDNLSVIVVPLWWFFCQLVVRKMLELDNWFVIAFFEALATHAIIYSKTAWWKIITFLTKIIGYIHWCFLLSFMKNYYGTLWTTVFLNICYLAWSIWVNNVDQILRIFISYINEIGFFLSFLFFSFLFFFFRLENIGFINT